VDGLSKCLAGHLAALIFDREVFGFSIAVIV